MRIYLIDDDHEDHDIFEMALDETNLQVELKCFDNSVEGLEILKATDTADLPDFVFLDLNMPKVNGKECLQDLSNRGIIGVLKVIVYSTSSNAYDISESKALGAYDYLIKPSSFQVLVDSLKRLLDGQPIQA